MDKSTIVYVVTILCAVIGMVIGIMIPAIGQFRVGEKALDAMARQPQASDSIRMSLFIVLAMLESLAIYILVVVLIILFANPILKIVGL